MASIVTAVDWQRPWLAPLLAIAQACLASDDWRLACNAAAACDNLCNHRGIPLRFVPQTWLPADTAYETYISRTGCVPTRANLHDFFNALIWLAYPRSKAALNAIQAAEIEKRHILSVPDATHDTRVTPRSTVRGVTRDRATIFDENAAVLLTCGDPGDSIERALREHRWQDALLDGRTAFGATCDVRLFGHALIEKLVNPYKAITAHVWVLPIAAAYFGMNPAEQRQTLDAMLCASLGHGLLSVPSTPLPVLGVPGWFACQNSAFYGDSAVFRPKPLG